MGALIVLDAILLFGGSCFTWIIPIIPEKIKIVIFILLGCGIPAHFLYMLFNDWMPFKRKLWTLCLWLIINIPLIYFTFAGAYFFYGTLYIPHFMEWQSWGISIP